MGEMFDMHASVHDASLSMDVLFAKGWKCRFRNSIRSQGLGRWKDSQARHDFHENGYQQSVCHEGMPGAWVGVLWSVSRRILVLCREIV